MQIQDVKNKNHRTNTKNEKTIGINKANGLNSHDHVELFIPETQAIVSFVDKWLNSVVKQIRGPCK